MNNIIFDLDGTLLDTLTDLTQSTNYALSACNYPIHTKEDVRQMVGNGIGNLIRRAMPKGYTEAEFDNCLNIFRQHYDIHCQDNTMPYSGIIEMLQEMKQHGFGMAIVSNKVQSAVTTLAQHHFPSLINIAIGESPQVKRKPAPDMLLQAMKQLNATPSNTIYVGDSDVDILTAKAAGIECISVLWGFRDKDFLVHHGARTFAAKPCDLLNFLF